MLPVWDDLERFLEHAQDTTDVRQLRDGVTLTLSRFEEALAMFDVTPIAIEIGAPFDPAEHEAIAQHPHSHLRDNTVANVLQTGFKAGNRLLRPARVTVVQNPSTRPAPAGDRSDAASIPHR